MHFRFSVCAFTWKQSKCMMPFRPRALVLYEIEFASGSDGCIRCHFIPDKQTDRHNKYQKSSDKFKNIYFSFCLCNRIPTPAYNRVMLIQNSSRRHKVIENKKRFRSVGQLRANIFVHSSDGVVTDWGKIRFHVRSIQQSSVDRSFRWRYCRS